MGRESFEEKLLELFFNQPTKQWHFLELANKLDLAQSKLDKWLKRFISEKLIKRIKEKGKMPYYISNHEAFEYRNKKKIFAMMKLHETGFLNYLSGMNAKTVILFGSMSRSDWHEKSDIDLFVYGDASNVKIGKYEMLFKRDVQLFVAENEEDLKKMGPALLKNIIKGMTIKGDIPDEMMANACV
jgi:predicted nucleotidyltransferase